MLYLLARYGCAYENGAGYTDGSADRSIRGSGVDYSGYVDSDSFGKCIALFKHDSSARKLDTLTLLELITYVA